MSRRDSEGLTEFQREFLTCLPFAAYNQAKAYGMALSKLGMPIGDPDAHRVNASILASQPKIKRKLDLMENERRQKQLVDTEALLDDLRVMVEIAMARKPRPGSSDLAFDAQAAKSAIELLGKAVALWSDRVVHTVGDDELVEDFRFVMSKKLPPEEVEAILNAVEQRILARR